MENKAVERIRQMITPIVAIQSCSDTPEGIVAEIRHEYHFPARKHALPIPWVKAFTVLADRDGNVYSAPGIF